MHKVGTPIYGILLAISEIKDIVPVRWNGVEEQYIVCQPSEAQYYAIITQDDNNILIWSDCKNKELLIDIL